MRSIDANMQGGLAASTRLPVSTLLIEDHTNHLFPYQSPGLADQWSDVCLASDGSIIRVNLTRGSFGFTSNFQYVRVTDPSQAAQWSGVTTFAGGGGNMFQDGGCCVSNNGGTLRAFAQQGTGGNAIYCWTSTTNGASWTGPVSVVSPPASALSKGLGSAGNNDLFVLYDVYGGETMGVCTYSSGWSGITIWTLPNPGAGAGLAVYWTGSQYNLCYSDAYTLYSATYRSGVWTQNPVIAPTTSNAVGRVSPRLSFYDNLYHLCVNEYDIGTMTGSVYSYCRVRESADFIHWSDGWILHDVGSIYGGNVFYLPAPQSGSSGARYYFSCASTVLSTSAFNSANPAQSLDLSASILSYQRVEQVNKPAELVALVDNRNGQYNGLLNLAGGDVALPITPEACLKLSEGYKTGSPPTSSDVVATGVYRLTGIRIERAPNQNQLRLVGLDLSSRLDRVTRWQNTFSNQTIAWLVLEVCARAGLFNVALSGGSQLTQVVPTFVIQADQKYRQALNSLCNTYGLAYFLDQTETLQVRELQSSDSSVWTYQPEIETLSFSAAFQRANHIIVSGKPPGGGGYNLTTSEAYDDTHNQVTRIERMLHHVDQKLTTTVQTSSAANLILYAQQRGQVAHTIVVPLNPALQLLDVITVTDSGSPIGSGQSYICRISGHTASYDPQQAEYASHFSLEGR